MVTSDIHDLSIIRPLKYKHITSETVDIIINKIYN